MIVECKNCGKKVSSEFYNLSEYRYKKERTYFCSWKCMREHEIKTDKNKKKVNRVMR